MLTPFHDTAIDTTISNLVMSGLLERKEVARYMAHIGTLTDDELEEQLVASRQLLDGHYRQVAETCRN